MNSDEFFQISQDLEVHHGIFSRLWQMGRPSVDTSIPTACIKFDSDGNYFQFCFNPDFYNSIDYYTRKFIVCHESLHVILNHGLRIKGKDREIANIAADIVINESLVSSFGFDRSRINNSDKYCWYDTSLNKIEDYLEGMSMEYYYELLLDHLKKSPGISITGILVDVHDGFGTENQKEIDEILGEICDGLNKEEIDSLKKAVESVLDKETKESLTVQAGKGSGGISKILKIEKVKKKEKWETIIKKWANKYIFQNEKDREQWARINRRFVCLDNNTFIPTDMETDSFDEEKRRIKVAFFLDTSGSCAHLAERFFKAALSLPKSRFDIDLFCFDTKVYPTTLESKKVQGFGGTSFTCIEEYIKSQYKIYPLAVFVITDGAGDVVSPQHPKRWYWFLSADYKQCIPKISKIYKLSDFE